MRSDAFSWIEVPERVPAYIVVIVALPLLGLGWRLVSWALNRDKGPPASIEVFRFSPVWRVMLHTFGVLFCIGAFVLPRSDDSSRFEALAAVGVFCIGIGLSVVSEVFNRLVEIRVRDEVLEVRTRNGFRRIRYSDIQEVSIHGVSLFIRCRNGDVHDSVAAFSRLHRMLEIIQEHRSRSKWSS